MLPLEMRLSQTRVQANGGCSDLAKISNPKTDQDRSRPIKTDDGRSRGHSGRLLCGRVFRVRQLMSKVKDPVEKKRLAYERDHYNRGGQTDKGWRKIKPRKKAKARRVFRRTSNALTRVSVVEEATPTATIRRLTG